MHKVATARHLRFILLAQEFHVILALLSAHPVVIFVGPDDDIWLTAFNDVSHFVRCPPTLKSHCVLSSAPADDIDTNLNVLFSTIAIHRHLTVPVHCLLRGALFRRRFPEYPPRNVLFSGARLLVSDFTWFPLRCDPPSAVWRRRAQVSCTVLICTVSPHRDIATYTILAACSSHVLCGSCPHFSRRAACAGVLVSACVMLGCAPDADDPPYETEVCGVEQFAQKFNMVLVLLLTSSVSVLVRPNDDVRHRYPVSLSCSRCSRLSWFCRGTRPMPLAW